MDASDTRRSHGTVRPGGAAYEYCSHGSGIARGIDSNRTPLAVFKLWLKKSCDREVDTSNELELGFLILPMSDLYTSLHISPKKKRFLSDDEDDTSLTPKRLRPAYVNHLPLFRGFLLTWVKSALASKDDQSKKVQDWLCLRNHL